MASKAASLVLLLSSLVGPAFSGSAGCFDHGSFGYFRDYRSFEVVDNPSQCLRLCQDAAETSADIEMFVYPGTFDDCECGQGEDFRQSKDIC